MKSICVAVCLILGLSVLPCGAAETADILKFAPEKFVLKTMRVNDIEASFRAYTDITYVAKPVDEEYQRLNLYIPEAYFEGKTVNGYTARTAPIFMPNNVGGYMPALQAEPGEDKRHGGGANAVLTALSRGYVVAAPAIRGRTLKGQDGRNTGKAPAFIVDYKAAVRYLRHNRDVLPAGDTEKIISNGTSAGGALSTLLGVTGNVTDYDAYLKEIGAADERDDIFASMAYCPVTNLENANMAYEWVFNGIDEYHQVNMGAMPSARQSEDNNEENLERPENAPVETAEALMMNAEQRRASDELKAMFPVYVNGLGLKDEQGNSLTLDDEGHGSFQTFIESLYIASAQEALERGEDLSSLDWLTVQEGRVVDMDLSKYALWATRMKAAPAFDSLDNSSGENSEFGTAAIDSQHFTEFSERRSLVPATMAKAEIVKIMNPMNYIGTGTTARHWRIRHGSKDRDTALAVPAILALKLREAGYDVDLAVPWGYGHDGDYDLDRLFDWMDKICKGQE